MSQPGFLRATIVGIMATLIMTFVMYRLPVIGYPALDVISALGGLSLYIGPLLPYPVPPYFIGAGLHVIIGVILALIYALFFYFSLPGPNWFKGTVFSLLPWLFVITLLEPSIHLASRLLFAPPSSPIVNPCAPANPCTAPGTATPRAPRPTTVSGPKSINPWIPEVADRSGTCPQLPSLILHLVYGFVVGVFYRHRTDPVKVLR